MAETTEVWMPGGLHMRVLLRGEDTGGAFCLLADTAPPGWGLPPHSHANESESIYVVSGRFAIEVDGVLHEAGPGDTVHIPAGAVHSGGTVGDEPGERVIVFSPAGMENFFLSAGVAAPEEDIDLMRVVGLAQEHGWTFGG